MKAEGVEKDEEEDEEEEERLVVGQPVLCVILSLSSRAVTLSATFVRYPLHSVGPSRLSAPACPFCPPHSIRLTVASFTPTGLLCSGPTFTASVDLSQLPSHPFVHHSPHFTVPCWSETDCNAVVREQGEQRWRRAR